MADELDALGVRWEYEPQLFVLETNGDGHCSEGFQPDFYLPDHDVFVEVTMAKVQTPKNRKIRKLKEKHPHITIFLFGRAEFANTRESLKSILAMA